MLEDAFAAREPHAATTTTSHDAPKMWTKFGEMEEAEEEEEELMDLPQQVDLSPNAPTQSPPDYVPSPEHLVADKYPEMPELPASCVVEAVDLDLELGDAGAGASAEIVEQEDVAL